jgi:hypothetical protein
MTPKWVWTITGMHQSAVPSPDRKNPPNSQPKISCEPKKPTKFPTKNQLRTEKTHQIPNQKSAANRKNPPNSSQTDPRSESEKSPEDPPKCTPNQNDQQEFQPRILNREGKIPSKNLPRIHPRVDFSEARTQIILK